MEKENKKENIKEIYQNLQKNRKKIKRRAIFLSIFLLGINAYAWFVFIAKASGSIDANVVAWDVEFYDSDESIQTVAINIDNLYPGMQTYTKELTIKNSSSLPAHFYYEIATFSLFGQEIQASSSYTSDDIINELKTKYPFTIEFSSSKTELAENDTLTFTIMVKWPFEPTNAYCKVTSEYPYNASFNYYQLSGGTYQLIDVTETDYATKVASGLYIEGDDMDTFWGEQSALFQENNPGKASISMKLNLIVSQQEK